MRLILTVIQRDTARAFSNGAALPIMFFLLVATLYPFAIGPDTALLARTGGGVLWVAALLAALLPVDRLVAPDAESGFVDQLTLRGVSEEAIALAKLFSHWLSFGPPLMLAAIPAAALLKLPMKTLISLELGFAIGTPGLAALAVLVASLTVGLRNAGALAGLLMLPLAIPLLIFGASSVSAQNNTPFHLLAATSLFLLAITPFAVGGGLRGIRD